MFGKVTVAVKLLPPGLRTVADSTTALEQDISQQTCNPNLAAILREPIGALFRIFAAIGAEF